MYLRKLKFRTFRPFRTVFRTYRANGRSNRKTKPGFGLRAPNYPRIGIHVDYDFNFWNFDYARSDHFRPIAWAINIDFRKTKEWGIICDHRAFKQKKVSTDPTFGYWASLCDTFARKWSQKSTKSIISIDRYRFSKKKLCGYQGARIIFQTKKSSWKSIEWLLRNQPGTTDTHTHRHTHG